MKKQKEKYDIKYNKEILTSKFLKYYIDLETSKNLENAIEIFKDNILNINTEFISNLLRMGIEKYNNVSYHNATHAYNTLYTGSVFLKFFENFDIEEDLKFLFLLCCYFHDVGHLGLNMYKTNTLEIEHYHIKLINNMLNICCEEYNLKYDTNLINELVISTNLLKHEEIIEEFKSKYKNTKWIERKLDLIDLKMLLKLADISTVYKKFKVFKYGGDLLEKEITGEANSLNLSRIEKDLVFMKIFAVPLAKVFSGIFPDFRFLYKNGKKNLKKLIIEKENISNKIIKYYSLDKLLYCMSLIGIYMS